MAVFGMSLAYQVRGQDDQLAPQRMRLAFERAGEDFSQFGQRLFPKLSPILEDEIRGQFAAQGRGPNRGKWKALSEAYETWKKKHFPGKPILEATGALKRALTEASSPNALRAESGVQFNFGTQGVPYASFHQTGAGRMPDRPPFDFTEKLERNVKRAGAKTAREIVKDSGVGDFATVTE